MIYEYPEEFVVPVTYVNDLREEPMHREWEVKYLQVEKLLIPEEKLQEDEISKINKYEDKTFNKEYIEKKGMNYLDLDEDILDKHYKKDMYMDNDIEENLWHDNAKSILNSIDNEYANSETLDM